jgi:hypothetical protein
MNYTTKDIYGLTIDVKKYKKLRTNQDIKRLFARFLNRRTGANSAISILAVLNPITVQAYV